jgi:hypothetical protein
MNTQRILPFLALLLLLALAAPALATVTVTVAMPANNATVTSPVNIVASATTNASGASVTGWHIYVDSVDSYANAGPTSSINTNVAMASGDHTVIVRAWDSTGAFGSQTLTLHVTAGCGSGICVNVTSPTAGTTVGSPVHFTAGATSAAGNPITGFVVYVNNNNVYRNTLGTLDAWVVLDPGTYSNVYIRAWDSSGSFGTSLTFSITVSGTVIPTPPASAVVFNNLDDASGWGSCGDTGCAGGGSNATSFPLTQNVASPSRDGGSAHIAITGPAWADALWWKKVGAFSDKENFLWDWWFYLPASSTSAQALEFDAFQFAPIGGTMTEFMFGTECNYALGVWDGWNQQTGHWVHTSFPCAKFSTGTWHHATLFAQRVGDNRDSIRYGSMTIDGTTTQWNLNEPSAPTPAGWTANTGVQFQLDENSTGTSLEEWFDDVKLTIW